MNKFDDPIYDSARSNSRRRDKSQALHIAEISLNRKSHTIKLIDGSRACDEVCCSASTRPSGRKITPKKRSEKQRRGHDGAWSKEEELRYLYALKKSANGTAAASGSG